MDEYPLLRNLITSGHQLQNFDDRHYIFYAVGSRFTRLVRRLSRPGLLQKFNRDILSYVEVMKPSHLIYFKAVGLHPETIMAAKRLGATTVGIFPDLDPRIYGKDYLRTLRETDFLFHTKPNLIEFFQDQIHTDANFVYPFFDPSQIEVPLAADEKIGVSFVGHWSIGKEKSLIKFSSLYTGNVSIFGEGWKETKFSGLRANVSVNGPVYGSAIQNIYRRSICVLGFLMEKVSAQGKNDEITSRSILVPASGGVLLHQKTKAACTLFKESSSLLFSDISHAVSLAEEIKGNNKLRIKLASKQQHDVLKAATNPKIFLQNLGIS